MTDAVRCATVRAGRRAAAQTAAAGEARVIIAIAGRPRRSADARSVLAQADRGHSLVRESATRAVAVVDATAAAARLATRARPTVALAAAAVVDRAAGYALGGAGRRRAAANPWRIATAAGFGRDADGAGGSVYPARGVGRRRDARPFAATAVRTTRAGAGAGTADAVFPGLATGRAAVERAVRTQRAVSALFAAFLVAGRGAAIGAFSADGSWRLAGRLPRRRRLGLDDERRQGEGG